MQSTTIDLLLSFEFLIILGVGSTTLRNDMHEWDPEEDIKALEEQSDVMGENEIDTAKRLLKENLVGATAAITQIALYSDNEKLRFDASKYIIERNMGKADGTDNEGDPVEALIRRWQAEAAS